MQLRAHGEEHRAACIVEGGTVSVQLREPAAGIAPGQAVVVYDGRGWSGPPRSRQERRPPLAAIAGS